MPEPSSLIRLPADAPDSGATGPVHMPVLGVPLALIDYAGTLNWIDQTVAAGGRGYVCVANTHTVTETREDPELRHAVLGASLVVPDGQPLVWALRALGHPLPGRVYGPELMARACERALETGRRFYLYGGRNQGALVQLALELRRQYPGLAIVGGYSPPFRRLTDEERRWVIRDIDSSGAEVVWVGIGVPKQEKWMAAMRSELAAPVLVGVGAAFDFHAGLIRQAPVWMQEAGLEWAYRLGQEPLRLGPRYLRNNPRFLAGFAQQWAAQRGR